MLALPFFQDCFLRFIWKTGPARNAWLKRMRQIDIFLEARVSKHAILLDHGRARSQQVRITPNKFRLLPRNQSLSAAVEAVINMGCMERLAWCGASGATLFATRRRRVS